MAFLWVLCLWEAAWHPWQAKVAHVDIPASAREGQESLSRCFFSGVLREKVVLGLHLEVLLWKEFPIWTFRLSELTLVSMKIIAQHFEKLAQFFKNTIFWETYPLVINNLEQMDNRPFLFIILFYLETEVHGDQSSLTTILILELEWINWSKTEPIPHVCLELC